MCGNSWPSPLFSLSFSHLSGPATTTFPSPPCYTVRNSPPYSAVLFASLLNPQATVSRIATLNVKTGPFTSDGQNVAQNKHSIERIRRAILSNEGPSIFFFIYSNQDHFLPITLMCSLVPFLAGPSKCSLCISLALSLRGGV